MRVQIRTLGSVAQPPPTVSATGETSRCLSIVNVQRALAYRNLYRLAIDGIIGPATRTALAEYLILYTDVRWQAGAGGAICFYGPAPDVVAIYATLTNQSARVDQSTTTFDATRMAAARASQEAEKTAESVAASSQTVDTTDVSTLVARTDWTPWLVGLGALAALGGLYYWGTRKRRTRRG